MARGPLARGPWPGGPLAGAEPWPGKPLARGALGPGGPWKMAPSRAEAGRHDVDANAGREGSQQLGPGGPWPLARGALGPGALGPGGPSLGPGGPWPRGAPLARALLALGPRPRASGGPWPGGPWPGGPLARGALGPGGPWPGRPLARERAQNPPKAQNHEIEQPACLDPLTSLLVQESSHQGPGGPRGGGRQTLNPKP